MVIQNICLYVDYKLDESYMLSKIFICVGNYFYDLYQIELIELEEFNGWLIVFFLDGEKFLRIYMLQIVVLVNYQNGRDIYMRQIKIYVLLKDIGMYKMLIFIFVECVMYSIIK